jgi:hypothetical protein
MSSISSSCSVFAVFLFLVLSGVVSCISSDISEL